MRYLSSLRGWLGLLTIIAGAACSAEVTFQTGDGAGGGSSGSTASSGGGSTAVTTGTGGHPGCGRTHDRFEMKLELGTGPIYGCAGGDTTGYLEIEGMVLEVGDGLVVVDSCPPFAICNGTTHVLTFSAPRLANPVPQGALVRLQVQVDQPMGCTQSLMITNLPEWEGLQNPIVGGTPLWLGAADGTTTTLPGAPFSIATMELGCVPDDVPGCGPVPDDYLLAFEARGEQTLVKMGNESDLLIDGAEPQHLALRNLRSFESGACDDYWNWGWWAAGMVVVPF